VRATLPPALAAAGVTTSQWSQLMDALARDVLPFATGGLAMCLSYTFVLLVLPLVWLGWRDDRYQRRLAAWLAHANDVVFRPRGCLAKFQTYQVDKALFSWLAVALTPDECAALAAEPTFWRQRCCDTETLVPNRAESTTTCCCHPRLV
jgi:hypothetical protein